MAGLFAQRDETGYGSLPILEVYVKARRSRPRYGRRETQTSDVDREKYKRAVRGDIAYNMMRMWQGAVGVAPVDGLVLPGIRGGPAVSRNRAAILQLPVPNRCLQE